MNDVRLSPDEWVFYEWGFVKLNATIVFTWVVMALLCALSTQIVRRIRHSSAHHQASPLQTFFELIVDGIRKQIHEISRQDPAPFVPFVGTLFLLIATASLLSVVPGYQSPTSSLSTTAALAACVLFAVPIYGIASRGWGRYFAQYVQPSVVMLPFNIIGEVSRTLALAVRLYGNMMSGAVIAAVLLAFVPLFVPIVMQLLGLLTGIIQAYIFAVLAMVYIASATRKDRGRDGEPDIASGTSDELPATCLPKMTGTAETSTGQGSDSESGRIAERPADRAKET